MRACLPRSPSCGNMSILTEGTTSTVVGRSCVLGSKSEEKHDLESSEYLTRHSLSRRPSLARLRKSK